MCSFGAGHAIAPFTSSAAERASVFRVCKRRQPNLKCRCSVNSGLWRLRSRFLCCPGFGSTSFYFGWLQQPCFLHFEGSSKSPW